MVHQQFFVYTCHYVHVPVTDCAAKMLAFLTTNTLQSQDFFIGCWGIEIVQTKLFAVYN